MIWRCYYRMPDGQVLRDPERHSTRTEALLWSRIVEDDPDGYYFRSPSGKSVPAREVIVVAELAVRAVRRVVVPEPLFA